MNHIYYGNIFFEEDSPLRTSNFPRDDKTILLGASLRLEH